MVYKAGRIRRTDEYTTDEAAAYIGTTKNNLANKRFNNKPPTYIKRGKTVYYRKKDLDKYLGIHYIRDNNLSANNISFAMYSTKRDDNTLHTICINNIDIPVERKHEIDDIRHILKTALDRIYDSDGSLMYDFELY